MCYAEWRGRGFEIGRERERTLIHRKGCEIHVINYVHNGAISHPSHFSSAVTVTEAALCRCLLTGLTRVLLFTGHRLSGMFVCILLLNQRMANIITTLSNQEYALRLY